MNKNLIIGLLFTNCMLKAMDEPPRRKALREQAQAASLTPIIRSKTAPSLSSSEDPEKDNQAVYDFLQVRDDMALIKAEISKNRVARTLTPNTQMLITLDPKLVRISSKDLHEFSCRSSLIEGVALFNEAQKKFMELDKIRDAQAHPETTETNNELHAEYLATENKTLKALCIFVSAYERDCPNMFPFIITSLNVIMHAENIRKPITKNYEMLPGLLDFKDRLRVITEKEDARKNKRKSVALPPEDSGDANKIDEQYRRAAGLLGIAKKNHESIIKSQDTPREEYEDIEQLYCDILLNKFIRAFRNQSYKDEKEQIFAEIQENLNQIHSLKALALERGFPLTITEDYQEICKFVEFHKKEYEIPESEKGKVSWQRSIRETKDSPLPSQLPPPPAPRPDPEVPVQKSRTQKLLEILKKPFSKK